MLFSKVNLFLLALLAGFSQIRAQSFDWGAALPEDEGFSSAKLYAMRDTLAKRRTSSLLVIRNDKILLEWYAEGGHPGRLEGTASMAKALVGGMSLLLAEQDGRLKADDPAWKYIPEWKNDPLKSRITIRHLATHTSGIEDSEVSERDRAAAKAKGIEIKDKHMDIPGWKGGFWRREPDPFSLSRDEAPVLFPPGAAYQYSNPGMAMLSYAITSSYRGTQYPDIRELLWERVYKPIGIRKGEWFVGYGKTYHLDGLNLVANWGGAGFTPRAAARIARLMLHKGSWEGRQLLDSSLVKRALRYAGMPIPDREETPGAMASGLAWYSNFDGVWPQLPRDAFMAAGAGNRVVIGVPSLDLIVVRNGGNMYDPDKEESYYFGIEHHLVNMLMDALVEPPYPQSEVIGSVGFAPAETIARKADGSDNWPITWGDDDQLYTAYGDGWGFEPKVETKLSLGLARVTGGPEGFRGANIRSGTGEQIGQGRAGKKASGMLMVDGTLYMWLRNANQDGEHSQLAWSEDHGNTWQYSAWQFTESFGCPTFLNFGRNYEGARDNYVYVFSQDEKDAYKPADRMVLARVPKDRIRDREAYEFYKGGDAEGKPLWTADIRQRGAVFSNPGSCYRGGISYNAGLKRYLWCQSLQPSKHPMGVRYQGGFGIYEAPEPWGPWRTVYYTKDWDVGPGETISFPTKWMSGDGRTCYMVFSGNDCFSVRKVIFGE